MDWELIYTGLDGSQTYGRFVRDASGGRRLELKEVTPAPVVNAIVSVNQELAASGRHLRDIGTSSQDHRRLVARIPVSLYWQLRAKLGSPRENQAKWKAWLNDPENRLFRTAEGKA